MDDAPLSSLLAAPPAPPPVAARPPPMLQRFTAPTSTPPQAAYAIVGKAFATYSSHRRLRMGRSHALAGSQMPEADVPTLSLGDAKVISRSHLELRWDPAPPGRWILQAIGKNGFWIGTDTAHKIVPNGNAASEESKSEPPSIASTSTDTSCLYLSSRRATQFRIGLDKEAVLFWFLPVVPEPKKRTPKDPAAAAAAGTTGASEAKPKKRKAEDAEAAATLGPDGKPVKKRRKKASTAADVPASAAATSAGAPTAAAGAVIMVDDDPDMPPLAAH